MPNFVPGVGPLDAKIVCVGESWGQQEAMAYARTAKHTPFVGMAGQLLDKLLHAAHISRNEVYVTNVIREQPKNNDVANGFFTVDRAGHVSVTAAYQAYENYLMDELEAIRPNVIVPLGNVPLYALTRKLAITKRRGSILEGTVKQRKVKVIPTIHPAAALRQYIWNHFIAFDLRRIREESAFPEINLPARNLRIRPSFEDVLAYLGSIRSEFGVLQCGVDIEVVNEEVSCIAFAKTPWDAMCIPFRSRGDDYFSLPQESAIWLEIARICQDHSITKVGQNIVFDATFIFRKYGIRVHPVEDTMVACAIAYPDFPKGLDFITSVWTKEPYYKDEGKKWFKFGGSDETFWEYNAKDACVCLEALPRLLDDLAQQGNMETYNEQRKIIAPLIFMSERGIRADTGGLKKASEAAEKRLAELEKELHNLCGYPINPDSPKQLAEYFYIKRGHKPYVSRKTGGVTTDGNALKRLSRKGFREAAILLESRKLAKLKGTYFDMRLDGDGRIRCAFNPVGAKTGRLSSSQTIFNTGGNMQNLPPVFLQYILADEGYIIYVLDLSQAENRIVAYIAPEPAMISAFENGRDIHSQTASFLAKLPADQIKREDKEGIKCKIGTGEYSWRHWGKKSNHSFNYDLGYKAFAFTTEMSEAEGKVIYDSYHGLYPGVKMYHAWIRARLSQDRTIENCLGRKRRFLDRWDDTLWKEAYAQIPQSTVADIINRRGLNYIWYTPDEFEHVELLDQVHDSIVFQIPISVGWEYHAQVLLKIKQKLETPIVWRSREFVIPVDIQMGFSMNKKSMEGVNANEFSEVTGLAGRLSELHEKLRASNVVQTVGGDLSDCELPDEEVQAELGSADILP